MVRTRPLNSPLSQERLRRCRPLPARAVRPELERRQLAVLRAGWRELGCRGIAVGQGTRGGHCKPGSQHRVRLSDRGEHRDDVGVLVLVLVPRLAVAELDRRLLGRPNRGALAAAVRCHAPAKVDQEPDRNQDAGDAHAALQELRRQARSHRSRRCHSSSLQVVVSARGPKTTLHDMNIHECHTESS